jgi:hypothetical protein
MYHFGKALQNNLLDLLVDGPSSFAALYAGLIRHCGYPQSLSVSLVGETLLEMEKLELVKAQQMASDGSFHPVTDEERQCDLIAYQVQLPTADLNDVSMDEIGLWYELCPKGRGEWRQWIDAQDRNEMTLWTLDDYSESHTVVIKAQTLEVAQVKLQWWLSINTDVELISNSRMIQTIQEFTLQDGTVVHNGIKLSYQYSKQNR